MFRTKFTLPGVALALACGAFAQTGTPFCNATVNSTGMAASLSGSFGSGVGSDLHLEVSQGPPNEIGYFLAGNEVTPGMVISEGLNCLVGTSTAQMFRYYGAGPESISVGRFDGAGVLQNLTGTSLVGSGFDVPATIPSSISIPIVSGDTWHFQLWYRDTAVLTSNSNFSNGLSVTFDYGPTPIPGMVQIPAGTFSMGSDAAGGMPYYGDASTQPVHDVTVSQDVWMGEQGVRQAEYQALMGTNPSEFVDPALPVEHVSWDAARAYCAAMTLQEATLGNIPTGFEYRLPTEAEWEYACRAGTTTEFNVGAALSCAEAECGYSFHSGSNCDSSSTTSVGSYPANAFGLYDMHGNVMEWCLDTFGDYDSGALSDPFVTGGSLQVLRGGSWGSVTYSCRSANRGRAGSDVTSRYVGFRMVLAGVLAP